MNIGSGEHTYEWIDNWATIPETPSGKANGRTHGVCVSDTGLIYVFNQASPSVLAFDPSGALKQQWGAHEGAHGMTLVREGDDEFFWLTDQNARTVEKSTLDGEVVQTINRPDQALDVDAKYVPTWVAVNPANGDIWVADGYGSSLVHRWDADGSYIATLTGEEGAGRFQCPHGIMFDAHGELWVADRGNHRLTVYDGDGNHLRANDDVTHSPCGFVFKDDVAYIPELFAGVKLVDRDFKLVANLGDNFEVKKADGWPNLAGTLRVQPGKFNSPHGIDVDDDGNIYVVEWIVGGRITKLQKV